MDPIFKGRGPRTLPINSGEGFGEHGIPHRSKGWSSIHHSGLSGCKHISTFTELSSSSFDLVKYPQLGWYLNNSGIFPLLDPYWSLYHQLSFPTLFPDPIEKAPFPGAAPTEHRLKISECVKCSPYSALRLLVGCLSTGDSQTQFPASIWEGE